MKTLKSLFALSAFILFLSSLSAQTGGVLVISSSPTATTANYDKIVAAMKEKGVWEVGWNFHAMGAAQPAGLFGIGFYPSREACNQRLEATKPVFEAAGLKPDVQISDIHNSFVGAVPAAMPAKGIVVHFNAKGMTAAQYDQIIVELQKVTTFPPAGQIAHACYKTEEGYKVVDVWESPEAFDAMGRHLMPILQKLGIDAGQPSIYSLYNCLKL